MNMAREVRGDTGSKIEKGPASSALDVQSSINLAGGESKAEKRDTSKANVLKFFMGKKAPTGSKV